VLTAASHTVKVQWDLAANNMSAQCRPVTAPDQESATLIVEEVSV
jgi:hypothetical protein